MSALNFKNLKIITKDNSKKVDNKANIEVNVNENVNLIKLENVYKKVQKGDITERDFYKTMLRTQPKLLNSIDNRTRSMFNLRVKELLNWYISLKKLLINLNNDSEETIRLKKLFDEVSLFTNSERLDKNQSLLIKNILELFMSDDIIKPKFNVSEDLIIMLFKSNRSTSFIKEIALCFGLYRKYLNKLAESFAKDLENGKEISFNTIDNIQPRFSLVNNHIFKSIESLNSEHNRSLNINAFLKNEELMEINDKLILTNEISGIGLRKRLNEINKWLNNGIIHTQNTYNRLNNLKIRRNERNNNKILETPINTNYALWCLIKDTESILATMEDLLIGKSFLTGVDNIDALEVLDVTY